MAHTIKRPRYPKGTWMKLKDKSILVAYMDNPRNPYSTGRLAQYAGCSRSFIGHLRTGYKTSCTPQLAQRIAEALGVPLEALFDLRPSAGSGSSSKRREKVAA